MFIFKFNIKTGQREQLTHEHTRIVEQFVQGIYSKNIFKIWQITVIAGVFNNTVPNLLH